MTEPDFISRVMSRIIGVFAPGAAMRYLYTRQVMANYTGAKPTGPNKGWNPRNQSADSILHSDRARLLARSRDLERNSGHISGAIDKICNNVVYTGIFPQARFRGPDGKLLKDRNDEIEGIWKSWADEVFFYDTLELIVRHLWVDGECLIHDFLDRDLLEKGLPPLGLEVLETDYLDASLNGELTNGNKIKSGIEYNKKNKPVAYHLFKSHPGEHLLYDSLETRRIPVDRICHVFHKRRASQGRGVPWLSSIIVEMRDFAEYQSSERIGARLASAFGAFIESQFPENLTNFPLPGVEENQEALPSLESIPKYFEPGRIDVLPYGMKVNVAQYNKPGDSYEPFTKTSLKSASAGTGMSYENFSNDYEGATYSSARQALLEERRGYRKMQLFLNRHFCRWVWDKWTIEYGNLDFIPVQWQNPGWSWIDPAKDAKGAQTELDMMITTRRRLAAERGLDWDEEIEEYAEEAKIIKEKGLIQEKEVDNEELETSDDEDKRAG